jgi:aspartate/glutamate racemase
LLLHYSLLRWKRTASARRDNLKTIGLRGGMSWESSAGYYRLVSEQVKVRLGGFHSARCVLYSVDFAEIERLQQQGDWDTAGEVLAQAAYQLERAGAELLVVCTNCTCDTCAAAPVLYRVRGANAHE